MAKKLANEDSSSEDIDLDIPPYVMREGGRERGTGVN